MPFYVYCARTSIFARCVLSLFTNSLSSKWEGKSYLLLANGLPSSTYKMRANVSKWRIQKKKVRRIGLGQCEKWENAIFFIKVEIIERIALQHHLSLFFWKKSYRCSLDDGGEYHSRVRPNGKEFNGKLCERKLTITYSRHTITTKQKKTSSRKYINVTRRNERNSKVATRHWHKM